MTIATLLFALVAIPASTQAGQGEPILLDFTSPSCGPCRQMAPGIEQLARTGFPVRKVDVGESQELAAKYRVSEIPAFLVVDPEDGHVLARTKGSQPIPQLVEFYNRAKAKYLEETLARAPRDEQNEADAREETSRPAAARDDRAPNPKPWETVVRIKVHGNGSIGFGSGTIVYSDHDEALILTCAHIFKMEGRKSSEPARFPLRITVDLFDGNLSGPKHTQVRYANETFEGKAIDYDFARDVGLIRIRPGRKLPHAKVVPPHWNPKANMQVITVGCSEGHDATAWSTLIVNPKFRGFANNGAYEAIECKVAPRQGRSGGGLFTTDGYIIGVCDFAEPRGDHGLYAHPSSIYHILNRNKLMALYTPAPNRDEPDRALAANLDTGRGAKPQFRFQSQDRDESNDVTLPAPEMLGIKTPVVARTNGSQGSTKKMSWHTPVDMKMAPSSDTDRFDEGRPAVAEPEAEVDDVAAKEPEPVKPPVTRITGKPWRRPAKPLPELSAANAN